MSRRCWASCMIWRSGSTCCGGCAITLAAGCVDTLLLCCEHSRLLFQPSTTIISSRCSLLGLPGTSDELQRQRIEPVNAHTQLWASKRILHLQDQSITCQHIVASPRVFNKSRYRVPTDVESVASSVGWVASGRLPPAVSFIFPCVHDQTPTPHPTYVYTYTDDASSEHLSPVVTYVMTERQTDGHLAPPHLSSPAPPPKPRRP